MRVTSFSILGRIVGTATTVRRGDALQSTSLSVSSVGSWALQRAAVTRRILLMRSFSILGRIVGTATCLRRCRAQVLVNAFSILGRIVGTATARWRQRSSLADSLSVSSVGSWALQHRNSAGRGVAVRAFQYPRSDRGHCNAAAGAADCAIAEPFSILGRIVGTATVALPLPAARCRSAFQYPRSDRGHCNRPLRIARRCRWQIFQYPRSDRGHCNRRRCRVATAGAHDFQYPRSDRGHCNVADRRDCRG